QRFYFSIERSRHERGLSFFSNVVRAGAGFQQAFDDSSAAIHACEGERSDVVAIGSLRIRTRSQEDIDDFHIVTLSGPMEGCRAVELSNVHVHALSDQRTNTLYVGLFDSIRESKIGAKRSCRNQ